MGDVARITTALGCEVSVRPAFEWLANAHGGGVMLELMVPETDQRAEVYLSETNRVALIEMLSVEGSPA
jgi:hypothetical protein